MLLLSFLFWKEQKIKEQITLNVWKSEVNSLFLCLRFNTVLYWQANSRPLRVDCHYCFQLNVLRHFVLSICLGIKKLFCKEMLWKWTAQMTGRIPYYGWLERQRSMWLKNLSEKSNFFTVLLKCWSFLWVNKKLTVVLLTYTASVERTTVNQQPT